MGCQYEAVCSGCSWLNKSYAEQLAVKAESFSALWAESQLPLLKAPLVRSCGEFQVRDRVDLMYEKRGTEVSLGFLNKNKSGVVDVAACPLMSPSLAQGYTRLRDQKPVVTRRGSIRLRVSPAGEYGVWLDFSNWDIKQNLDNPKWLRWLRDWSFVELGQRHKALDEVEGQLKLKDPQLKPWFATVDGKGTQLLLYGPVGGFSQVGLNCNRVLVGEVRRLVRLGSMTDWVEVYCGNGNLTLGISDLCQAVTAIELDALAVDGARQAKAPAHVEFRQADAGNLAEQFRLLFATGPKGLLVDPPRSGLGRLLDFVAALPAPQRPQRVIYVSCFLETLARDAKSLVELGYNPIEAVGVDQFPQTPHCEWIVSFEKK